MKERPKLISGARADLTNAIANLIEQHNIYKTCLNCINFREDQELCKLANQRPPARVIAYGCKAWEDKDEIPF